MYIDYVDIAKVQRKLSEFFGVQIEFSTRKVLGIGVGVGVAKWKFIGVEVGFRNQNL